MDNRYAISTYPDAAAITKQLDELIKLPIYSVSPEALKRYEEEYFDKKCAKSKVMIEEAKTVIPGGVQHNLAFNHPFPLVFTKAEGAYLYDIDGNQYYDFLQAGGPTVLGSNPKVVRDQVIELLNTCGPSTGLFHEFEYKLAKKVCDSVPNVEMFRMLNSGSEACMAAVRVARLATKNKNIIKMGGAYHGWSDQLAYGIRVPGSKFTQAHGVPLYIFKHTQEFFPNDLDDLERKLRMNQLSYFKYAFLDPNYIRESPQWLLDAGAMDSLSHGIEGLLNRNTGPITSVWNHYGFSLFASFKDNLLSTHLTNEDFNNMQLAGSLQGMGQMHSTTTIPHGLGYSLTHFKGVTHGIANAVTTPAFLKAYSRIDSGTVLSLLSECGFSGMDEFEEYIGAIVRRNVDIAVTHSEIEAWAEECFSLKPRMDALPFAFTLDDIRWVLEYALRDYIV